MTNDKKLNIVRIVCMVKYLIFKKSRICKIRTFKNRTRF